MTTEQADTRSALHAGSASVLTADDIRAKLSGLRSVSPTELAIVGGRQPELPPAHPWDLIDIRQAAGPQPTPTLLRRTDGAGLFYPGTRNMLIAPYESAKTWVALLTCLQVMQSCAHGAATGQSCADCGGVAQGGSALYIDFESSPRAVGNRLRVIGGMPFADQFGYIRPTLPVDNDRLDAVLERLQPTVCIIDACAEAMVTHQLDEGNNAEFMKFSRLMLEPLEERGIGVVLLDHLGHQGEKPRGASAKLATVSGSALRIEVETPFRRGHSDGMARVFVSKDREGAVREVSTADTLVAYLHLVTDRDGGPLRVELDPPAGPVQTQAIRSGVRPLPSSMAAALQQRQAGA